MSWRTGALNLERITDNPNVLKFAKKLMEKWLESAKRLQNIKAIKRTKRIKQQ
ncbi:hypothetical protein JG687_00004494 [Phytophthora cactorum]|uniref:Uncharacterized protein n=1 Tax=Phytophthora cactorum TaxID=29920 RepID=A0A329S6I1_9STRA|nr:hypothetical protein Pcac1_g11563 [Phytophthora cactorum]KAG2823875.1 hypothetical protein PC112_g10329 [Phytophthora cactorum]KAG2825962.1 hypothetical protein PC111_g9159 [Phytophthora cactorum]KAG2857231.1 hypothetical protein PC113_g10857 [Phytophthora cactorum]KAG2905664.1 hypothetical protein PC114_g11445 [Phytophthora cactorum]